MVAKEEVCFIQILILKKNIVSLITFSSQINVLIRIMLVKGNPKNYLIQLSVF